MDQEVKTHIEQLANRLAENITDAQLQATINYHLQMAAILKLKMKERTTTLAMLDI